MIHKDRRFCTFSIPDHFIQNHPRLVVKLLNGFLILHCERSWTQNSTRYEAWHEELPPVPEWLDVPRMDVAAYVDPLRLFITGQGWGKEVTE
jgi:hypothetical protein